MRLLSFSSIFQVISIEHSEVRLDFLEDLALHGSSVLENVLGNWSGEMECCKIISHGQVVGIVDELDEDVERFVHFGEVSDGVETVLSVNAVVGAVDETELDEVFKVKAAVRAEEHFLVHDNLCHVIVNDVALPFRKLDIVEIG